MTSSPASILFDKNGNAMAVSGTMALPTGTLGLLIAGVEGGSVVRYLSTTSGSLGVSSSFPLQVWQAGPMGISGTVTNIIGNWPATIGVSASVQLPVYSTGPVGITGSTAIQIWSSGLIGVSGNISTTPGVTQTAQNVSSSSGVRVWNDVPVGISASVQIPVYSTGPVGVTGSGQFSVNNFPATQNVSGSITVGTWGTNVTASVQGAPGGIGMQVWIPGTVGISGSISATPGITQTATNVSSSSGVRVFNDVPVGISGAVALQIWSAGQIGVSGSLSTTPGITQTATNVSSSSGVRVFNDVAVGVSSSSPSGFWFAGTAGVSGTVTSIIGNWPATVGVTASSPSGFWSSGPQAVSASSPSGFWSIGPQAISGSQLTGSTFAGFPVVMGGVYPVSATGLAQAYYVRSIGIDPSGSVYITSTGSIAVAPGDGATFNVSQQGQVSVNNFPATQNVSGTVTSIIGNWPATHGVSASFPLQVWNEGTVGVSGTVSLGSQVSVNNFPATQNVSGTVTAIVGNWPATLGVSASFQLPVYSTGPVGITGSTAIQIWSAGQIGVSGSLSTTPGITQTPASVTGSQLTGSTFAGFPVTVGAVYSSSYVQSLHSDVYGNLFTSTSGSWQTFNNASVTAAVTSSAVDLGSSRGFSCQATFINSQVSNQLTATCAIQGSNDTNNPPAFWTTIANSQQTAQTGPLNMQQGLLWNFSECYFRWVRFTLATTTVVGAGAAMSGTFYWKS